MVKRKSCCLDATFAALADPTRRRILEHLSKGKRRVTDLAAPFSISLPAVSKHLRVLRTAGLVDARQEAQRRLYRIRPEPLAELDAWLASYRQLWSSHLDRLETHLEQRRKT